MHLKEMLHVIYKNYNDAIDPNWAEVNIIFLFVLLKLGLWSQTRPVITFFFFCHYFLQVTYLTPHMLIKTVLTLQSCHED